LIAEAEGLLIRDSP